jgi:hypothetical protein
LAPRRNASDKLRAGLKAELLTVGGKINLAMIAALVGIFAAAESDVGSNIDNTIRALAHQPLRPYEALPFWETAIFAAVIILVGFGCIFGLGAQALRRQDRD